MSNRPRPPAGRDPALERRLGLARAAILWERLWPALWPPLGVAGLFLALALLDLWSHLPGTLHAIGLGLFGAALLYTLLRLPRRLAWPERAEARRRLEQKNGLPHRPLTGLEDQIAGRTEDPGTLALWHAHRARLAAAAGRLRVGLPEPGLPRRDPFALRAAIVLVLVLGASVANEDAGRRVLAAFTPNFGKAVPPIPASVDAWLSPPPYTGLAPIFLTREDGPVSTAEAPIRLPAGSTLLARVHGARGTPELVAGSETLVFQAIDGRNHQLSHVIAGGEHLTVSDGRSKLAEWRIEVIADKVPEIQFSEPPTPTQRQALRFGYKAKDDYGLAKIGAELRRDGSADVVGLGLPLSGLNPKTAGETSFHDLTPHPWAGLEVAITLTAEDGTGQIGRSAPVRVTLPERAFRHPVARAVIEQRRLLTLKPETTPLVARALRAIASLPESYREDTVVLLSLRTAAARILANGAPESLAAAQDLLWDVALRIEDGNLSLAERELRQAQRELQEALARNAPDSEIERLMQQLQQALDRFLQAMAEEAMRQAQDGDEQNELPPEAQILTREDLQRMLDRARELSRSGSRDAARDMLSQLQNMLENLKSGRMARQNGQQRGAEQGMKELGEIMRKQQQLLDQSFRRSQQGQRGQQSQRGQQGQRQPGQRGQRGQPGQPGQPGESGEESDGMEGMAGEQEGLRQMLGEMMRRLGEAGGDIPGAFGRAERSMRDARDALGQGQPGSAVGPQTDALDQLRQGMQSMMQQMLDQMGNGPPGQPRQGRAGNNREDPLGRPLPGEWDDGDTTKVPDEADVQRAREILEELYRRAGDRRRPDLEREYIDRLLRRF